MMQSKKHILSIALFAISIILLTSCGGGKAAPDPSPTSEVVVSEAPTPEPTPDAKASPFIAPLTGLGRETAAEQRPVAVVINNYSAARPQANLTEADVLWEVLAEGGITRIVAIFQSTEDVESTLGPVRSIRPYLIEIGEMYQGVIAHAGASPDGYAILQYQKKPYLDEISNAGPYFFRSKDRKAPHNLYTTLEKLRQGAEKKGYKQEVDIPTFRYDEAGATAEGQPATNITLTFMMQNYKVGYKYDEATGKYARTIGEDPHMDINKEQQLTFDNLVVIEGTHKTLDNEGRLAIDLKAGGEALLFQKGKVIEAEWIRGADQMIRIIQNGVELPFIPGKTFYHVVPNKPSFAEHVTWIEQ